MVGPGLDIAEDEGAREVGACRADGVSVFCDQQDLRTDQRSPIPFFEDQAPDRGDGRSVRRCSLPRLPVRPLAVNGAGDGRDHAGEQATGLCRLPLLGTGLPLFRT